MKEGILLKHNSIILLALIFMKVRWHYGKNSNVNK
nr:MAG TPA: hypothetical protein [Caudoviricetes sp.]